MSRKDAREMLEEKINQSSDIRIVLPSHNIKSWKEQFRGQNNIFLMFYRPTKSEVMAA